LPAVTAAEAWNRLPLALRDSLPAWLLARVIALASLGAARYVVDEYPRSALARSAQVSLVGWDAGFYDAIARFGYAPDPDSYRFFPLYPLATRVLDAVTPGSSRVALVLLANACSLGFVLVLHRLVMRETGDADVARRAAWFGCIAPAAFVLVWGYAEPLFLLLAVSTFLMLRTDRFALAGVFGALAALTRPLGLVIALPAAVEAVRGWSGAASRSKVERVVAIIGAPVGALGYLLWVNDRTGDLLEPYRIQARAIHRGSTVDPVTGLVHAVREFVEQDRVGPLLHVGWAVVGIALVVVAFRRLPVSYGVFAAATIVISLSSENLDSFERYAFNAFPLVIAAAIVVRRPKLETLVFTAMGAAMCLYGIVAALGVYVP
jgi:Mannosyltransferase (PIG-V)